jgi:hypothetical protein
VTDPVALTPRESDTRAEIERHLWEAIDLMAATLVKPDERIWGHLLVYRPALIRSNRDRIDDVRLHQKGE